MHDNKVQPMGEAAIADITYPEDDSSRPPSSLNGSRLKGSDVMDLVVVCVVQISVSFKSIPYPYHIPALEHSSTTLGESMFALY